MSVDFVVPKRGIISTVLQAGNMQMWLRNVDIFIPSYYVFDEVIALLSFRWFSNL